MKKITLAAACAGAMFLSGAASAATLLYDETIVPQNGSGSTTFYDDDNDFNETWDFSSISGTVDYFELTLDVSGATDDDCCFGWYQEDWEIRAQGSINGSSPDDLYSDLSDGTNTFVIDASSDTGSIDVFAHSVATGMFTLWLAEESADWLVVNPSITVSSANLKVYGEVSPVPLAGRALRCCWPGLAASRCCAVASAPDASFSHDDFAERHRAPRLLFRPTRASPLASGPVAP